MYRVNKQFHFSSSHKLEGLPREHECGYLHGHNYTVEVVLESEELDCFGFVRMSKLHPFQEKFDGLFAHIDGLEAENKRLRERDHE